MKKGHLKPGTVKNIKWNKWVSKFIVDLYEKSIRRFEYMSSRKRAAKIIWFLLIIGSIAACTYQIYTLYAKWQSNPVIVTFDTEATPIWKIPFPAVTICPQAKSNHYKFKLSNLVNKTKYSRFEKRSLSALAHVCQHSHSIFDSDLFYSITINNQDIINDLMKISFDSMKLFYNVDLMGFVTKSQHFYKMFTNEGICFSYNLLEYKFLFNDNIDKYQKKPDHGRRFSKITNWTLENGYHGFNRSSYPFRALASGTEGGLNIDLKSLIDDIDPVCGQNVDGYKIALHTPGEFPRFEKHFFQIPFGQFVMLSVKPRLITTSEKLRNYSPDKRQCYFDGEKPLNFFKMYTQSNCELECITEYTKSMCGCVKFSMPHSNDTRVCSYDDRYCYIEALSFFNFQNIADILKKEQLNVDGHFDEDKFNDLRISDMNINDSNSRTQCDCLPACTSLQYDAEISQNLLNVELMSKSELKNDSLSSSVNIYFREDQFFAMERHELYGWIQFIANSGGLVGLFMGFSIVSVIETIYYIMIFKTKKNDRAVKLIRKPKKPSNKKKTTKFINVSTISDDFNTIPKFKYLP